ncbi:MAG: helix-turn-helix transcriptional regulator [Bythopirellula sp.]|nr:helix-turn-helix transcriptional regulator [Bythopirellula sp.]
MQRQAKSIFREATPAELARLEVLWEKLDKEKPEIIAKAKAHFAAEKASKALIAQLKAERESQGLSLADVKKLSGITREAISAMENAESPNPTIKTLQRYAMALGVKLEMSIR